jgi:hypothetical protein
MVTTVVVLIILAAMPCIPLAIAWRRIILDSEGSRYHFSTRPLLILITGSFFLLLTGLLWRPLIGLDYTTRRFTVIYINFGIVVLSGLCAVFFKNAVRMPLLLSALLVSLEWLYLATVSSVV